MQIVAMNPSYVGITSIDEETRLAEENIIRRKIQESGKSVADSAVESIVKSSLKSFYSEKVLLEQEFAIQDHDADERIKVKEYLHKKSQSLGIKGGIRVESFEHFRS